MSDRRTIRSIIKELVDNPFFPILFIGEFVKKSVENGIAFEFGILALIATVIWILSDVLTWEIVKERIIGIKDNE